MPAVTAAPADTMADRAIRQAKVLEVQKREIQSKVSKNRELLRLLDDNEELTEPQGRWLDTFYPTKRKGETGDPDASAATKKLRDQGVTEVS